LEKQEQKHKEQIAGQILDLRKELDLPNDEHLIEFLKKAEYQEIKEILEGLEELAKAFKNYGNRTFAHLPLD
jgi:cobalamin biosynthesis Mg chelatase CobN